jgi:hypothetical protein
VRVTAVVEEVRVVGDGARSGFESAGSLVAEGVQADHRVRDDHRLVLRNNLESVLPTYGVVLPHKPEPAHSTEPPALRELSVLTSATASK